VNPDDPLDLGDDDQLLAHLATALDRLDPVPPDAIATAEAAARLGRADAALAELVYDSLADAEAVAMRSDTLVEARGLGFVAGGYRLDVELLDDGRVVLGQLDPVGSAEIALETQHGTTTTTADTLGRFRFGDVRGPLRLRVTTSSDVVVLTPWITW
jgi:hypothetical protein